MMCQSTPSTFTKHTESTSKSSTTRHTFIWKIDHLTNVERTRRKQHRLPSNTDCVAVEEQLREPTDTCDASPSWMLFVQPWGHAVPGRERRDELKDLLRLGHTKNNRGRRQVFDARERSTKRQLGTWASQTSRRTSTLLPTREDNMVR